MVEEPEKQPPKQLQPYVWRKGQSGNPAGRPKGKTFKEFAREYLMSLPDEEKIEYLASLATEIVRKMAEGNPENKTDLTSQGKAIAGFNFIKNGWRIKVRCAWGRARAETRPGMRLRRRIDGLDPWQRLSLIEAKKPLKMPAVRTVAFVVPGSPIAVATVARA